MAKRDYYLFVTEDGRRIPRVRWGSWAFVLFSGLLLAAVALIDRGGIDEIVGTGDGSTGCQVEVTTEQLNVRSGPSQDYELVGTLSRGERVDATLVVVAGFRELEDQRWASNEFLTPVPGTDCS